VSEKKKVFSDCLITTKSTGVRRCMNNTNTGMEPRAGSPARKTGAVAGDVVAVAVGLTFAGAR